MFAGGLDGVEKRQLVLCLVFGNNQCYLKYVVTLQKKDHRWFVCSAAGADIVWAQWWSLLLWVSRVWVVLAVAVNGSSMRKTPVHRLDSLKHCRLMGSAVFGVVWVGVWAQTPPVPGCTGMVAAGKACLAALPQPEQQGAVNSRGRQLHIFLGGGSASSSPFHLHLW